jgi:hypothetical protein
MCLVHASELFSCLLCERHLAAAVAVGACFQTTFAHVSRVLRKNMAAIVCCVVERPRLHSRSTSTPCCKHRLSAPLHHRVSGPAFALSVYKHAPLQTPAIRAPASSGFGARVCTLGLQARPVANTGYPRPCIIGFRGPRLHSRSTSTPRCKHRLSAHLYRLVSGARPLPHAGRAHARIHHVSAFAHVFSHFSKLRPAAHTDACARGARANITAGHMNVSVYSALKRITAVVSHLALGAVRVPHRRSATHGSRLIPRVIGGKPRSFLPRSNLRVISGV